MAKKNTINDDFSGAVIWPAVYNAVLFGGIVLTYWTLVPFLFALNPPAEAAKMWDIVVAGGVLLTFWTGVFLLPRVIGAFFRMIGWRLDIKTAPEPALAAKPAAAQNVAPERIAAE